MVVSLPSSAPGILIQDLQQMESNAVTAPFTSQLQELQQSSYLASIVQLQLQTDTFEIFPLLETVFIQCINEETGTGNIQVHGSDPGITIRADKSFLYCCLWSMLQKLTAWNKDGVMQIFTGKWESHFLAEFRLPGIMHQHPETYPVHYFGEVYPVWQTLMQAAQVQLSVIMQPGKDMYLQVKCPLA